MKYYLQCKQKLINNHKNVTNKIQNSKRPKDIKNLGRTNNRGVEKDGKEKRGTRKAFSKNENGRGKGNKGGQGDILNKFQNEI